MTRFASRVTRALVIASVLLAIVVGLWPMQPGLFLSFAVIVAGIFFAGRFWPDTATTIVETIANALATNDVCRIFSFPCWPVRLLAY